MRILGQYKSKQFTILVDIGSTHSFMDARVAVELKLPLIEVPEMAVTVVEGRKMSGLLMCSGFIWWVQQLKFTFDLRVLNIGSFDIILGVNWIKLFNPIFFDFTHSTVSINREGRLVILQDIRALSSTVKLLPCYDTDQLLQKKGTNIQYPFCIDMLEEEGH